METRRVGAWRAYASMASRVTQTPSPRPVDGAKANKKGRGRARLTPPEVVEAKPGSHWILDSNYASPPALHASQSSPGRVARLTGPVDRGAVAVRDEPKQIKLKRGEGVDRIKIN